MCTGTIGKHAARWAPRLLVQIYLNIHTIFNSNIYSDIRLCQKCYMNMIGSSFVSKCSRMSHSGPMRLNHGHAKYCQGRKIRNFTKNPMFFENPKILPKSEISPTFNIFLKIKKKPKSEMFSQSPKFFPKSEIFPKIQFLKFV